MIFGFVSFLSSQQLFLLVFLLPSPPPSPAPLYLCMYWSLTEMLGLLVSRLGDWFGLVFFPLPLRPIYSPSPFSHRFDPLGHYPCVS